MLIGGSVEGVIIILVVIAACILFAVLAHVGFIPSKTPPLP